MNNARLFAWEGPVGLDGAIALDENQPGIRAALERYADEIVSALTGADMHGFVLALLGPWGSGKTSAMLTLLDLVKEHLRTSLPEDFIVETVQPGQEPLARAIQVTDANGKHWYPVTSSVLRAPLSLGPGQVDDARLALAHAILWQLPPEMRDKIAGWLGEPRDPEVQSPDQQLKAERFLHERLRQESVSGTDVERWITSARRDCLAEAEAGETPEGTAFLRRNLHLTMLDDFDRARLDFTAQILNAMRFWVDNEGMFFIVAAQESYLTRAAEEAEDKGAGKSQDNSVSRRGLHKFIHHELHLPPMFRTPVDVANYWRNLLIGSSGETADSVADKRGLGLLREALDAYIDSSARQPLDVLTPLLSPRVVDPGPESQLTPETPLPREAKRSYNALVGEIVDLLETADIEDLKLNVAAIAWRDAYLKYVHPALSAERIPGQPESPEVIALRSCLDLAEQVLPATTADLMTSVFRLGDLARRALINLADIPATLLLYLAAEPRIRRPLEPVSGFRVSPFVSRESEPGKSAISTPLTPGQDAESARKLFDWEAPMGSGAPGFALRDPAREAEATDLARRLSAATGAGDIRLARSLMNQLVQLIDSIGGPDRVTGVAPTVGNAAVRSESHDTQLAWDLHRLAYFIDPRHPNVRLNLADFLIDYASGEEAWTEAQRQLEWLAANEPDLQPERQLRLRAQLAYARGNAEASQQLVQDAVARALEPTASFDDVASALVLLQKLEDRENMEMTVRQRLALNIPDDQGYNTYRLLRLLGDQMIAAEGETEARGVDILRHLVARSFCPADDDLAAVLSNLALIYNSRGGVGYEQLAGMLWRHALELDPSDTTIRQAYARYLEQRDQESGRQLLLGRMPNIPLPSPDEVRRVVAGLPPHLSSGPWWWERYSPPAPSRGFPELAIPGDQESPSTP